MNAGTRLALYGGGLVVAFAGAFFVAGAIVPEQTVTNWTEGTEMKTHNNDQDERTIDAAATMTQANGLSLSSNGYALSPVTAPAAAGEAGSLSFQIQDSNGEPVVNFVTAHDKDLHLIVVRSDGDQFRHDHPTLDTTTGTWSIPWEWSEAGTYRVFTDFTVDAQPDSALTLTRTVQVGGQLNPDTPELSRASEVDGFTATIDGDLTVGSSSALTVSISRDGQPVTTIEPYLGAFGHLVALREGDLAYLHVHAEGDEPTAGQTSGPTIEFAAEAPTAGRYLLYLDFQVDGVVRTAEFVLNAEHVTAETGAKTHAPSH